MKNNRRVIVLCLIFALALGSIPATSAQNPITIRWFVGLGTGGNPEQIEAQNAVAEAFNASQDEIVLEIEVVENNIAYDNLKTQIASGSPPDIVGPVGIRGANEFFGLWLPLDGLIESTGYDLSVYPDAVVDFYREGGQLLGIPFGVFPQVIYFNRELFDEAGLDYPPQSFGEPYADGEEWNYDKLRELALLLTVDENGNDATMDEFDPENIIQWGFVPQWGDVTQRMGSAFGSGSLIDEDGNAQFPDPWRASIEWHYNAMWVDRFMPNSDQMASDLLAAGNPFDSGNVAMAQTFTWYTCCIGDTVNWDLAVNPSFEGNTTAPLHADTFRILESTEHPEEAFAVLTYLLGEAAPDLLDVYGALPAREGESDAFFARLDERYTQGVNWQVVIDSLAYPDNPSHEAWMPNFAKADDRVSAFTSLIMTTGDLNLDAEIETLVSDLQSIFDEVR